MPDPTNVGRIDPTQVDPTKNVGGTEPSKGGEKKENFGAALYIAFAAMVEYMQGQRDSAAVSVQGLQANAKAQNSLINQEAEVHFSIPGTKILECMWHSYSIHPIAGETIHVQSRYQWVAVTSHMLERAENNNMGVSAQRTYLQSKVQQLSQCAQIKQTNINTDFQNASQTQSTGASLQSLMSNLANRIAAA